jgi:signal transduction histidine kinase
MCGREIEGKGILCEKCDKPRTKKTAAPSPTAPEPELQSAPEPPSASATASSSPARNFEATARDLDSFPKAPIVPFPVESATPAITSVVNLLVAAGVASIFVGPDRSVKFASDEAKRLFDAPLSEVTMKYIEQKAGLHVGDLSVPTSAGIRINERNILYTLVPMSGGASGAVLVFRFVDPMNESHASFVTYVLETVLSPLRSMRDSMRSAAETRQDHYLADSAVGLDQILSSLEMAPEIEEPLSGVRPVPTVSDVVRRVAERFRAYSDLKGIQLVIDVQDLEERFADHDHLAEALAILMDNALHYVPASGQVVIGVRWMEHKGKPLLLFFVMDNGPLVPEPVRQSIFEPSFVWSANSADRTGRGLFKCREFAVAHAGSVWVESKTGKACTFFLRVRPDGMR